MRKILYLILIIPFLLLQSCLKDDKDVFDAPSSARVQAAMKEYKTVLTAATNGWVMEYYPESNQAYGGVTILVKFGADGLTTMTSEMGFENGTAVTATSTYALIAETSVVLTFDTYNEFIHYFCDANPGITGVVDGFKGDYEFTVVSATSTKVELRGKKTRNTIMMYPLDANTSWDAYLTTLEETSQKVEAPAYQLYVGTEAIGTTLDGLTMHFDWAEGEKIQEVKTAIIYTNVGIKFYKPITIKGVTMQNFTYNATTATLECTDGVDAKISQVFPPLNEIFAATMGQWYFNYDDLNSTMKASWDAAAVAVFDGYEETLVGMFLGYYSGEKGAGTCIGIGTDLYWAVITADFTPVTGTEDQMTIVFTETDLLNWSFYEAYYRPFLDMLETNSPYKLVGNAKNPTEITFTSMANANVTFTIAR